MARTIIYLILLFSTMPIFAASYSTTGLVDFIRIHDISVGTENWMAIQGLTSAGACGTYEGKVVIRMRDDVRGKQQVALATTAKITGTEINVTITDTIKDSRGYCYLRWIDL